MEKTQDLSGPSWPHPHPWRPEGWDWMVAEARRCSWCARELPVGEPVLQSVDFPDHVVCGWTCARSLDGAADALIAAAQSGQADAWLALLLGEGV